MSTYLMADRWAAEAAALSNAAPATCQSGPRLISHGISRELGFPRVGPRRTAKISLRFLNECECSLVFAIPSFSPGPRRYMINDLLGGRWQKSPHSSQAINNNDYWFFDAPRHKTKWTEMTCGLSGTASGAAGGVGYQSELHIISVGCKFPRGAGGERAGREALDGPRDAPYGSGHMREIPVAR